MDYIIMVVGLYNRAKLGNRWTNHRDISHVYIFFTEKVYTLFMPADATVTRCMGLEGGGGEQTLGV